MKTLLYVAAIGAFILYMQYTAYTAPLKNPIGSGDPKALSGIQGTPISIRLGGNYTPRTYQQPLSGWEETFAYGGEAKVREWLTKTNLNTPS